MKDLTNEERPIVGKMANEVRSDIEKALEEAKVVISRNSVN